MMFAITFILSLVSAASAANEISLTGGGSDMTFPAFSQCDRDMTHAPYRVNLMPSQDPAFICFHVAMAPCDERWKCCTMDLHKFELEAKPSAKANVKAVYVNGVKRTYEFNSRLSTIRITDLNKSYSKAAGTTICIATQGLVNGVKDLCRVTPGFPACKVAVFNSGMTKNCCPITMLSEPTTQTTTPNPTPTTTPTARPTVVPTTIPSTMSTLIPTQETIPIVPVYSDFPFDKCNREPGPLALTKPASTPNPDGTTLFCFNVESTGNTNGPCGSMSLDKVEFEVNPTCVKALSYMSVNGIKRPPFFQAKPNAIIKVTNLNRTPATAAGTQICLAVKAPCATLETLCAGGACNAALFNYPQHGEYKCCPVTHGLI